MLKKLWWKEEVVYQIYPKSFYDSNKDGIGDIQGIIEKLDYLKKLGVTSLWICPIFKSPMIDNGYDISDYIDVQDEFGTMKDLDTLIEKCKSLEIKIILDLVVNHTSHEHHWFKEALKNPEGPYGDFYIFKNGKNGKVPNNWRSIFGGSVWEPVPNRENLYYFHTFHKGQPDLNWENPNLRREIYKMINWWLEKGIGGFRIDSITFVKKDQDYLDSEIDGKDGLSSVKHKGRNRPGIEKFLYELNRETFEKYRCVTVGEAPGVPYEQYNQYIGENGYFNMIFDFKYADIDVENGSEWFRRTNWTTKELKEKIFKSQEVFQKIGWGANFLENHDQPRSLTKYIRDEKYRNHIGAKALGCLFFFLRGTPFIYQGQELGMENFTRENINEFDDVSSIDNYNRSILEGYSEKEALNFVNLRSRDNGRTPMQWDNSSFSGFTKGDKVWLGLTNSLNINVANQIEDINSVFTFYKKMIELRQNSNYSEDLIYGDFEQIHSDGDLIAYKRGENIVCLVNLGDSTQNIKLKVGEILLNNYKTLKIKENNIILEPYQGILITKGE